MPRARWKDWEPGQVRVKCQVVDEKGGCIETYMPKLTPEDGIAFNALMIECAVTPLEERPSKLSKSVVRAWNRLLKERAKEKKDGVKDRRK